MVTTQMKTDAQRFGNGKKGFNVKQVEEMLENSGGGYTAGTGIEISESKEISVADTVAMKTDIPEGFHLAENLSDVAYLSEDEEHWILKHNTIFALYIDSNYDSATLSAVYPKGTYIYDNGSTYEDVGFLANFIIYYARVTQLIKDNPATLSVKRRESIESIVNSSGVISLTTVSSTTKIVYNIYNTNYNNQKNKFEIYIGD